MSTRFERMKMPHPEKRYAEKEAFLRFGEQRTAIQKHIEEGILTSIPEEELIPAYPGDPNPFKDRRRERSQRFLERPDVRERIFSIVEIGKKVLLPYVHEYTSASTETEKERAFLRLQRAYADLYILTTPLEDPSLHPWVKEAEDRHGAESLHTQQLRMGKKDSVWLSTAHTPFADSSEYRFTRSVQTDSLLPKESQDLKNWHDLHGLLVHTSGAARLYDVLMSSIQLHLKKKGEVAPLNQREQALLSADVRAGAISFWGHDIGRLVTHDNLLHMVVSEIILKEIGLPEELRFDVDLATKLRLNATPVCDPRSEEELLQHADEVTLVWYLCDFYSKFIEKDKLDEETKKKLHTELEEYLSFIASRFRIRQRGDETLFLTGGGKFSYQNDPKNRGFYTHQVELVNTIFDHLSRLGIPNDLLRHAFSMAEQHMIAFLQQKTGPYVTALDAKKVAQRH